MAAKKLKTCYYETLQVQQTATDDELKKAYRIQALRWHPDKNQDNLDEATTRFKEVQAAYEVLSDPRERAWYDRHREEILRGRSDIEDVESFDLMPYFVSSCYSGFDDDDEGFYAVYRGVFEALVKEDLPYFEDGRDLPPSFGKAKSPYHPDVHSFYSHWQGYSTPRTYTHLDKYSAMDAPNRRVVRLMEKENSKLREAARKERNQEVRQLVDYVRKRDRRVQAYRREIDRQNQEKRNKSKAERSRQLQERQKDLLDYQENEWASMNALEQELLEMESAYADELSTKKRRGKNKKKRAAAGSLDDEDDHNGDEPANGSDAEQAAAADAASAIDTTNDLNGHGACLDDGSGGDESEEPTVLYCVACDKSFKNQQTLSNHENSKKHKANVVLLQAALQQDEESLS